jgi:hypothetical protein
MDLNPRCFFENSMRAGMQAMKTISGYVIMFVDIYKISAFDIG